MAATLPVVAIDVDEVLACFLLGFCAFVNETRAAAAASSSSSSSSSSSGAAASAAAAPLTPAHFASYHFSPALGMSDAEASQLVQAFFASRHFRELAPLAGARDVLLKHARSFRFVVVTSRSLDVADATRAWLDEHFAGVFALPPLFGCAYGSGPKRPKSELCREVGAVLLVDDQVAYCREAAENGVARVALFGRYAWNALSDDDEAALPPTCLRFSTWPEIDELLAAIAEEGPGKSGDKASAR